MAKEFIEIEGKILEIDIDKTVRKLQSLGAEKIDDYLYRRYICDVNPINPNKWVRLRTDGYKTTLTVKEISDDSIEGTQEWEIELKDFGMAQKVLTEMGIVPRSYQENKRSLYKYKGVEISIDEWPMIPPYIEIEAKTPELVRETAKLLGYSVDSVTGKNTDKIYEKYGINLKDIKSLKF